MPANNHKSLAQNERIVHAFAERLSPHELATLGVLALDALAKTMPTEEFAEFMEQSMELAQHVVANVGPAGGQPAGSEGPEQEPKTGEDEEEQQP